MVIGYVRKTLFRCTLVTNGPELLIGTNLAVLHKINVIHQCGRVPSSAFGQDRCSEKNCRRSR